MDKFVLVEKYQYALLYLLLTNEQFYKLYQPVLKSFYRIIFSTKYIQNLFLLIVKRKKDVRTIEHLSTYIDQAFESGKITSEEKAIYQSYLEEISEAASYIDDLKEHLYTFIFERLVEAFKESLNSEIYRNPHQLLSKIRQLQLGVIKCMSVLEDREEDLNALVAEIEGLHGELYIPFAPGIESCPGVRSYELAIIGAATGVGKSWFLLDAFWRALEQGKRVLFISLEMSKAQLYDRLLIFFTGKYPRESRRIVYTKDLTTVSFHELEPLADIKEAVCDLEDFFKSSKCMFVFSGLASGKQASFTIDHVLAEISRYEAIYGESPQAIIVDGIEFMQAPQLGKTEKWYVEAHCVSALKEMARDTGFAVLVNSHVIKNIKQKWVYPQDLSGGSEKSRVADVILTLSASSMELSYSVRRVLVAKNRMNVTGGKYWFPLTPSKSWAIDNINPLPTDIKVSLDERLQGLSVEDKAKEDDDTPF